MQKLVIVFISTRYGLRGSDVDIRVIKNRIVETPAKVLPAWYNAAISGLKQTEGQMARQGWSRANKQDGGANQIRNITDEYSIRKMASINPILNLLRAHRYKSAQRASRGSSKSWATIARGSWWSGAST